MVEKLESEILELLRRRNGLSFVELSEIDGFPGDKELTLGETNIVLWVNCSDSAVEALNGLVKEKKIEMKPTSVLTYHADGGLLKLPLAKSKRTYKTPRWLPTVINRGPSFK